MDYQIVHSIPGRIRFLITQLAEDPDYAQRLQGLVESIKFVTEVRMNPWAKSLVVSYKLRAISDEAIQRHLANAIAQADSSASPTSREKPSSTSPPVTSEPVPPVKTITTPPPTSEREMISEEERAIDVSHKFAIAEDPWDSDAKSNEISPPATEPTDEEKISLKQEVAPIETPPSEEISPLSTAALAKRLQVTSQTLTRNRSKPNFIDWTKAKDPEGFAWNYDRKSKTFDRIDFSANGTKPG